MPIYFFHWDAITVDHLAQHGVSPEEFEQVVQDPELTRISRTSGRPIAFGYTDDDD